MRSPVTWFRCRSFHTVEKKNTERGQVLKITNPNKYFTKQRSKLSLQVNAKLTSNNKKKEFYNIKVLERNVFSPNNLQSRFIFIIITYCKALVGGGGFQALEPHKKIKKINTWLLWLASHLPKLNKPKFRPRYPVW